MKSHLIRGVGLALALTIVPALVHAQKPRPPGDPMRPVGERCEGRGIRCLFGRAAPCVAVCHVGSAVCIGASCILGFPVPAECYCNVSGIG